MSKFIRPLVITCSLCWIISASAQYDLTIQPLNVVTAPDGSEAVANLLLTYDDDFQEVVEIHADGSSFSSPGGSRTPSVSNFPFHGAPSSGGSWGPPGSSVPPPQVNSDGSFQFFYDQQLGNGGDSIQGGGGIIIGAGVCVGAWLFVRGRLRAECRRNERQVVSMTIGHCGVIGASTVECSPPPPEPPEPPEPDPATNMWGWYGSHGFPTSWSTPAPWGWPYPGPYVVGTSGL